MPFRIMTICTANVCRSTLAEGLLRGRLDPSFFEVSSAGVRGIEGADPDPHTVTALQRAGVAPLTTTGVQVTPRLLQAADLILTATRDHRGDVLELYPAALRRTFTVLEFGALAPQVAAGDAEGFSAPPVQDPVALVRQVSQVRSLGPAHADIADPIGRDEAFHAEVAAQIDAAVTDIAAVLNRLAS